MRRYIDMNEFAYITNEQRQQQIEEKGIAGFVRENFGFNPDPAQADLLESTHRRVIVNCTRQWGKSTVLAARIAFEALTHPHAEIVILSLTEKHAWNLLNKADEFLRKAGAITRGVPAYRVARQLRNGAKILTTIAREDRARSFSPTMVVIDEAGHVPDSAYRGILPSLAATQGQLFIIGTPWKQRGYFYEQWHSGDDWKRVSVKATDCPRIQPEFIEEMRRAHGDEFVRREFLCEFVGDDDRLFTRQDLTRLSAPDIPEIRGNFGPRTRDKEYIIGVDLGKLRDYSAISILERIEQPTGRDPVTFAYTFRRRNVLRHLEKVPLGTAYPRVIARVEELVREASRVARVTLAIDATGVGEPVVDELRKLRLDCHLVPITITSGTKTTNEGPRYYVPKRDILVGMQGMIHRHDFEIASNLKLKDDLLEEFLAIGRTLRAEDGAHDDLVLSVGLAAWYLRSRKIIGEKDNPLCF